MGRRKDTCYNRKTVQLIRLTDRCRKFCWQLLEIADGTNAAQWLYPLQWLNCNSRSTGWSLLQLSPPIGWLATSWQIWTLLVGGFDIQQVVCSSISTSNKCFLSKCFSTSKCFSVTNKYFSANVSQQPTNHRLVMLTTWIQQSKQER